MNEVRELLNKLLEVDTKKRYSAKQVLNHILFKNYGSRALFNKLKEIVLLFLVHNSPSTDETLLILKIFRYSNTSGYYKLLKEELIEGLYE